MREAGSVPDTCTKMFDASIQEVNGKGPKKRKKSLDRICDNESRERSELNASDGETDGKSKGAGEKSACTSSGGVELLHWRDMPQHLQFNPYVLTGYRPLQGWGDCVRSLFYFHNETINILTHGVSLLYILVVLPWLLPWGGGGAWFLSLCHLLGALAPWCGSFLYHLFMNHTRGESLYHRLLQLDMLGIWVSQSIGAIPMVTATVYCAPTLLRYTALTFYSLGCLLGLYKAMRAWSPWERRLCFAAPFCMRLLLAGARAARLGGGDPHAILHVFLQTSMHRRSVTGRRCYRRTAHPGEVVPWRSGLLPQLAQYHARPGRARCLLHAPGDDSRPGVDVARGLPRATAPPLTPAAPHPPPRSPRLSDTPSRLTTINAYYISIAYTYDKTAFYVYNDLKPREKPFSYGYACDQLKIVWK